MPDTLDAALDLVRDALQNATSGLQLLKRDYDTLQYSLIIAIEALEGVRDGVLTRTDPVLTGTIAALRHAIGCGPVAGVLPMGRPS